MSHEVSQSFGHFGDGNSEVTVYIKTINIHTFEIMLPK